ncbi:MFS transporter [Neorhizobium sp. NCHU2750]|uniref:MFS transporter n=1 Tax=Neorhizobium sp. NCHU2750 TaxID=1825976 RepID=UPI000EB706B9|nr:MFS transporter [Neorhizobium sp. NCHU2750]
MDIQSRPDGALSAISQPRMPEVIDGLPAPRRYIAVAAVLAGITLAVLDAAIANVALPTMAHDLNVSPAASIWVVTGYQIALVMALLPCAALGESLGYRRVFAAGVVIFTVGSALCTISPTLQILVAARFLQGLGGAAIMSLIAALLRFTYPKRMLGRGIALNALIVALASAAGPTIGAAILQVSGWPWLFAVNIPIGVAIILVFRALPETPGSRRKIDLLSVILNAAVFAPLIVGAEMLATRPIVGVCLLAFSALCLVLLVRREAPRPKPLIPLDLLREWPFRISVVASMCCFSAQMVSYVALPFYLQHVLGKPAFMTGLYMTPWPLTVALAAPVSGRLCERFPTAWLCAAGGGCLAIGLVLCAAWDFQTSLAPLIAITIICGLGFGFFQTPNNRNMLLSAPAERSGAAGGMQATARLVGQTSGAVIMAILFSVAPLNFAPRIGLAIGAILALIGGIASLMRR